jgi:hypothetical protein
MGTTEAGSRVTLRKIEPCCVHDDHQRPYVNEDDWILTGNPELPGTWMAWLPDEWAAHCDRYTAVKRRKEAAKSRRRYHRRKAA